jgi:hypothetical protein
MGLSTWGASPDEVNCPLPGDELCPDARLVATRSITISAPPHAVFPWIRQMGFGRAGWYSYDWIDNLGRKSATAINPEWQNVEVGDAIPGGPVDFEAAIIDEPNVFVLRLGGTGRVSRRIQFVLAYVLRETDEGTRLVTRVRARIDLPLGRLIETCLLGPGDGIMLRKQLVSLRRRAEAV